MKGKKLFVVVLASCFLLIVSAVFLLNYPWLTGDTKPLAKIYFNETALDITFIQSSISRDFVQIIYTDKKGNQKIVKNIEDKNRLDGYLVLNDSTIRLILNRGRRINKADTVDVSLQLYEK
ncbi:MAG: hypothetical protein ABIN80_08585 [Dyadobacter sp.]|uniref:hypothetical protein n=1 Tax=Dyadobacter sp. TaxID=1914288 RepID=UPI003265844B